MKKLRLGLGWLALLPALALAGPPEEPRQDPLQAAVDKATQEIRKHTKDPTQVEQDAGARRFLVKIQADFSLVHPMFRQGTRPGRAVVTVQDGRWSLEADDPFLERLEKK